MRVVKDTGMRCRLLFMTAIVPLRSNRFSRRLTRTLALFATTLGVAGAHATNYTWGGGSFVAGVVAPQTLLQGDTLELKSSGTPGNQGRTRFWGFDGPGTAFVNEGLVFSSIPFVVRFENQSPTNTTLTIVNKGTWELGNTQMVLSLGNFVFENSGTLRQLANTSTSSGGNPNEFRNSGTIEVLGGAEFSGNLVLTNGSRIIGPGRVAPAGVRAQGQFAAENLFTSFFGGSESTLTGKMRAITISGQLAVNSGSSLQWLASSQTLAAGTHLLNRGSTNLSDASNSVNGPVLTLQGGTPGFASGAKIENAGTLTIETAGRMTKQANTGEVFFVNSGMLIKKGAGTFEVDSSVTFNNSGGIFVESGALTFTGGTTNLGRLGGAGVLNLVGGTLVNRGTVAPGNSPGTLSIDGNFSQDAAGTLEIEIASPTIFDRLDVTGRMSLEGNLKLVCYLDCRLDVGTKLVIAESDDDLSGSFSAISLQGFETGGFSISYDAALRQVSLVVTEATSPVPELPSSVLVTIGLLLLSARPHRRQVGGGFAPCTK